MSEDIRVYVDLEYCYPGMTAASGRPTEKDKRQIVQIAAILWDVQQGIERDNFDMLTFPIDEKNLPAFFTELTGITQVMLEEKGVDFLDALKAFTEFCGDYPVWTFNADWGVFRQNCEYYALPFPFKKKEFIKVKSLLPKWHVDSDAYSSGTLYQAAGLKMEGHVHYALHDVRSMAVAVHHFEGRARASDSISSRGE